MLKTSSSEIRAPYSALRTSSFHDRKSTLIISAGIILVVIFGGGLSMAAENTLPGDALYTIKLNVNEKVRSLAATTPESRAKVEIELAATRLAEAEQLAVIRRLDQTNLEEIKKDFETHAANASAGAQQLKAGGDILAAASVSSDFESTLLAHGDILQMISSKYSDVSGELEPFSGSVRRALLVASDIREQSEMQIISSSTDPLVIRSAARAAGAAANDTLSAAEKSVSRYDGRMETGRDVISELDTAEEYRSEGLAKLVAGAYGEALVFFGKANRIADKASLEVRIGDKIREVERLSQDRRGRLRTIPLITPLAPSLNRADKSASSTIPSIETSATTSNPVLPTSDPNTSTTSTTATSSATTTSTSLDLPITSGGKTGPIQ